MASSTARRPVPALVALVALLLLTGLVWWRVLNRSNASEKQQAKPCPTPTVAVKYPAREKLTLAVLNATTRTGIAGRARTTLIQDGFNVPSLAANAPTKTINKLKVSAEIAYGPAGKQGAQLVAYYFPGAKLTQTTTKSATITISLGTLFKGVASQTSVETALGRAHAQVGTPTPSPSPSPTC